jgi:hypothetical protein
MGGAERAKRPPILFGLLVLGAGLALAGGLLVRGCRRPDAGPAAPSAFYSACADWRALGERVAPDKAAVVDSQFAGSGAVGPEPIHHSRSHRFFIRGQEEAGRFLQALRGELRQLARQAAAEVSGEEQGTSPDGLLQSFALRFNTGRARGEVRARAVEGDESAKQAGIYIVEAKVTEEVR